MSVSSLSQLLFCDLRYPSFPSSHSDSVRRIPGTRSFLHILDYSSLNLTRPLSPRVRSLRGSLGAVHDLGCTSTYSVVLHVCVLLTYSLHVRKKVREGTLEDMLAFRAECRKRICVITRSVLAHYMQIMIWHLCKRRTKLFIK